MPRSPSVAMNTVIIEPTRGTFDLDLRSVWRHWELLYFLVWRDVKVRYKQTALGAGWAVLQPLINMALFTAIFSGIAKMPSDGMPYPIFAYAGLLPWTYFSQALNRSAMSLVGNASLITKVYFPRVIIPLSAAVAPLVDFAIAFVLLIVMMVWYGIVPTWGILALPALVLFCMVSAVSVSLWLAALYVRYRDVGVVIPFLIQIWMYASPIAYPLSVVPEKWQRLYSLNPMVGVVEGFRWALLGKGTADLGVLAMSGITVLVLLLGGIIYFKRVERVFADVV